MKVKVLRDKDTKEFIHLYPMGDKTMVCTGNIPSVHPLTATMELVKSLYPKDRVIDGDYNDFDNFELVEYDLIESGEVGADIRNKLGNYNNLVQLVEDFLNETNPNKKRIMKKLIRAEIRLGKETVEYLAKLL